MKYKSQFIFFSTLVCILFCFFSANAQARMSRSFNSGWKFYPAGVAYAEAVTFDDSKWENVSLPHTWNAVDPFDDDLTYKRGIGWYRKTFTLDATSKNKNFYLWFEAASQVADVYVNGSFAGEHKGGYTGFTIDLTPFLNTQPGKINTIAVQVNNARDPFIAPLSVGYASYGGIYRDAWLIITGKLHFTTINNNSAGVYITAPSVNERLATIEFRSSIKNESKVAASFNFVNEVFDKDGKLLQSTTKQTTLSAGEEQEIIVKGEEINTPHLWSPSDPYLYTVKTSLVENGVVTDAVENNIGFRWFKFEPGNGFFLNGKKLTLHGTNRHQDMQGKGDALTTADHRRDMQIIKNMGANFVRLAHYPQAPDVLRLADELGLLIWEEVPVVDAVTIDPRFVSNTENNIKEMITQGFNHPSVIMWGSNNEVFLHGPDDVRIGKQNDTAYIYATKNIVEKLDSTIRVEDPSRYSTMAMHGSDDYKKYGLDTISQVAGYNIYDGWYGGVTKTFGPSMDAHKTTTRNVFVSEYGAEGEVRLNTERPVRFDYTGQYQEYFHQEYLRQINARPWLAGTAIWNEFDFSQPNIGGPQSHRNQKGMVTWDRKIKDVYYLYKVNWNPEPMVYIASRNWMKRGGEAGASSTINVYSNAAEVTLFLNGKSQETKKGNDLHSFSWQVKLADGENKLMAKGKINKQLVSDNLNITYGAYQPGLKDLTTLSVNVGSDAQYLDASANVWNEDRVYKAGSFGNVGGVNAMTDRKTVIKNTQQEPLFYSYSEDIKGYKFDVANGQYRITLCFSEPFPLQAGERVFAVAVNGEKVINALDLISEIGYATAGRKAFITEAKNSNGVEIKFIPIKGKPILNGVKIERM